MPKVSMTVNGRPVSGEVEGRTHAGRVPARGPQADRHPRRLRHRAVRRLRRARRRRCSVKACNVFVLDVEGAEVRTIEGMANPDGSLGLIQAAFQTHHGLQCGFCTPGMVMTAAALLAGEPEPERGGDPRVPRGQHLPLHRLPQHRQGDPGGGGRARRRAGRGGIALARREEIMPKDEGIGASSKRREDVRFLTGKGRYTDDLNRPGQAYAALPALGRGARGARRGSTPRPRRRCRACSGSSPARTSRGSAASPAAGR